MKYLLRSVRTDDLDQLYELAKQFTLLNLPADRNTLMEKIDRSVKSFSGSQKPEDAEYIFVVVDIEGQTLVGSSQIIGKRGTPECPNYFFKVLKKERFSQDLGIGFTHQALRLGQETDGSTEIGGLLIDRSYRRKPERLGRQISLIRFLYMAMAPDQFTETVHCELAPPLTEDGQSDFWESLGRRFTGLPYDEADMLSRKHKEFIHALFPEEDIYLTLLEGKARLAAGRVGDETKPAQRLLEGLGFQYCEEVDPFDGGPHYRADRNVIPIISEAKKVKCLFSDAETLGDYGFLGLQKQDAFLGGYVEYQLQGENIILNFSAKENLGLNEQDEVWISPHTFKKPKEQ